MKIAFYFLILLVVLFMIACFSNANKSKSVNKTEQVADIIPLVNDDCRSLDSIIKQHTDTTSIVIFSTENLEILGNCRVEKKLKCFGYDNEIIDHEFYAYNLPDFKSYKVVIMYDDFSDSSLYLLSIVRQGAIYYNESLDITPESSTPDVDDGVYEIIRFKIFSDHMIKIYTEKSNDGHTIEKYTKYYRINDEGKFYEVKE